MAIDRQQTISKNNHVNVSAIWMNLVARSLDVIVIREYSEIPKHTDGIRNEWGAIPTSPKTRVGIHDEKIEMNPLAFSLIRPSSWDRSAYRSLSEARYALLVHWNDGISLRLDYQIADQTLLCPPG